MRHLVLLPILTVTTACFSEFPQVDATSALISPADPTGDGSTTTSSTDAPQGSTGTDSGTDTGAPVATGSTTNEITSTGATSSGDTASESSECMPGARYCDSNLFTLYFCSDANDPPHWEWEKCKDSCGPDQFGFCYDSDNNVPECVCAGECSGSETFCLVNVLFNCVEGEFITRSCDDVCDEIDLQSSGCEMGTCACG